MTYRNSDEPRISRRALLALGAGVTAAPVLSACGGVSTSGTSGEAGTVTLMSNQFSPVEEKQVGMAGLTLAGGYGPLNGRYGLALDGLLGAEVVTVDASVVTDDAELFWALRGGGTNFGVVTSLTYRLHHLPAVLAGMILFPLDEAGAVLRGYQSFLDTAPDEISVMAGFLPGPVVFVCPFYSGADLDAGRPLIAELERLGTPLVNQVAAMPYEDALRMFDGSMVDGNHYRLATRWLPRLTDAAIEVLTAAAREVSSPFSAIALHHFHGAATRPAPADTAFAQRSDHLLLEIIAVWGPDDPAGPHRAWAERTSAGVAPMALPGGYPNLLGPDETERVRLAYGGNYERLMAAKRRYDPDGVFSGVPTLTDAG